MRGHVEDRRGRWVVVLELDRERDPETGEVVRRRVGLGESFSSKREAREALHEAIDASRRGWRGPSRVTIADYLRGEWLPGVDLERAPTTAALYRTIAESYIIPRLGGIRLDALTAADLTKAYADLLASGGRGGRPLKPKTVRHVHTTLRKALADAVEARHLSWNPATAAKAPKVTATKEPAAWTTAQVARFLEATRDDRHAALWTLAATTGLRRGELLGLRWIDLDLETGTLTVRQTLVQYAKLRTTKEPKTERSRRTIPLPVVTIAALRSHRAVQAAEQLAAGPAWTETGLVFTDEIGRATEPATISATFKRHVRDAGLPPISLHGLRHTWATLALDAGVDVLYVAEVLGHSSPAITQSIYQHARPERTAEALERVAASIVV